ncbi:TetR/AcrR family transcriptional regulator [Streptomyces sp. NPDC058239]|uniref:TetR/AcrR family transcriptional regulator n=1 Tax=Streptomyces sp. NPDC058239 TaxID=3346395 RepID=UPI0036E8D2D4
MHLPHVHECALTRERSVAARARLLAAANELFYAEGVQSVGIDRVIQHAGVAKATLCSAFGSKDGLVRACLQARHAATAERMAHELEARYDTPKERLVGAFEVQGLSFTEPGFRGCAFISASADAPPRPAASSNRPRRTTAPGRTNSSSTSLSRQAPRTRSHSPSNWWSLRRRRNKRLAGPRPQRRDIGPHRSHHPGRRRHPELNKPTSTVIANPRARRWASGMVRRPGSCGLMNCRSLRRSGGRLRQSRTLRRHHPADRGRSMGRLRLA